MSKRKTDQQEVADTLADLFKTLINYYGLDKEKAKALLQEELDYLKQTN